jgi:hypothetical protein
MRKALLIALSTAGLFLITSSSKAFAEGKTVTVTGEG